MITLSIYYSAVIFFLRKGLLSLKKQDTGKDNTFSVIIAARNEEKNIRSCLDHIFAQTIDSVRYEVILVNDRSEDATEQIAREYVSIYDNFSYITITEVPSDIAPKKHALMHGIEKSKNKIIVFTDADCLVQPTWLETIDRYFSNDVSLVQGITIYTNTYNQNPLFFGLQAVDFLSHGIVAAAGIGAGLPINSNANNFAFRKEIFNSIQGFGAIQGVVSGDDDLLLQKVWSVKKWKIHYMIDQSGAVKTQPTTTLSGIIEQRKRWGSKTVHYTLYQKLFLSGIFFFYIAILISFLLSFFSSALSIVFFGMLIIKLSGELLLMWPGTRIFNQTSLRKYVIPASLLQLPMVLFAVLSGVFGRFEWKDQKFTRSVSRY